MSSEFLSSYLQSQRWFRSKGKSINSLQIEDFAELSINNNKTVFLLFLKLFYTDGSDETYFFPVVTPEKQDLSIGYPHLVSGGKVYDALADDDFKRWLVSFMLDNNTIHFQKGKLLSLKTDCSKPLKIGDCGTASVKNLNVEQSNSSFIFGDKAIVKVFRKKDMGVNPEAETLNFLTRQGFMNVPQMYSELRYQPNDATITNVANNKFPDTKKNSESNASSIATLQNFISNTGNAWDFVLDFIRQEFYASSESNKDREEEFYNKIKRIAKLTATMHICLASDNETNNFKPELINQSDIEDWIKSSLSLMKSSIVSLQERIVSKDFHDTDIEKFAELIIDKQAGFESKIGSEINSLNLLAREEVHKIRVHGDYHLGQVLNGVEDFYIFDFEGEPLRTLEYRKKKQCVLKDVAGILRSFDYAVGFSGEKTNKLGMKMREIFIDTYFNTCQNAFSGDSYKGSKFLLDSKNENMKVLKVFELEKAFYELKYEIENRPEWLTIPLDYIVSNFALASGVMGTSLNK